MRSIDKCELDVVNVLQHIAIDRKQMGVYGSNSGMGFCKEFAFHRAERAAPESGRASNGTGE